MNSVERRGKRKKLTLETFGKNTLMVLCPFSVTLGNFCVAIVETELGSEEKEGRS